MSIIIIKVLEIVNLYPETIKKNAQLTIIKYKKKPL